MATNQGLLQAQIKVKNTIDLNNAFSSPSVANPQLKSIEGNLNLSNEYALQSFNSSNTNTQHIDIIRTNSSNTSLKEALNNLPNLKYVRLEGQYESKGNSFDNNTNLQKVDLSESLKVKPEDFKANESLKTLPNLDYSNPDLTDIITNDTNLLPTTFDISNEPNTNKLGIHGDSTHQLGNLEFVKVNPEAPFDNQITPQIDVSYTSLDRNGLVNLFHSMPYNVGYTVVGSPTIVDGVASGFNGSNYLITSSGSSSCPTEGKVSFHYRRESSMNQILVCTQWSSFFPFRIRFIDRIIQFSWMSDNSTQANLVGTYSITEGDYYITFNYVNNIWTVKLYSSSNELLETLTSEQTTVYWPGGTSVVMIGYYGPTSYWQGSIDLNETYIKVNGVPWFNGKPSQIKVVDVSGATGTSSLTNDDKAIVTNKGWTLVTDGSNNKNYIIEDGKLVWADPRIYLESDGNQYIQTDYTPVQGDEVNVSFFMSSNREGLQTVYSAGTGTYQYTMGPYKGNPSVTYTKSFRTGGAPSLPVFSYELWANFSQHNGIDKLEVSGNTYEVTDEYQAPLDGNETTLRLFKRRNGVSPLYGKMKAFSITNNSVLKLHLVPVPAGLQIGNFTVPSIGMFDIVNQQFYANQGTGEFTYGWDLE